ncbi:MAG: xanthine dehydrogenase family protein molybdopterin-binding subunit, partial [Gammaproteobacteria bacterium]|nr:xanthine dehydrogenase family protein molybdopterin-binding subunit [Gammaproteobacteria bacterium]
TGAARFADDIPIRPGTLHAAIVRSPHASAEIESIDINSAASVPGVVRILTGVDVKSVTAPFIAGLKVPFKDWGIAVERVSFGGEPVALVLARDRYTAEDAAERVQVNYRVQPAVVEPAAATHVDSPRVHPETESNVVHERRFSYGNPDAVFAACERRIDIEVRYPRVLCAPMECYVVYAEYDAADHGYQVVANFQGPYGIHTVMARALGVTGSKFRLRTPAYSGGSFGSKLAIFTYIVLMSTASRLTGRPVKWVEDRLEHLSASGSGPERLAHLSAAVSADGTIEALRCDHLEDYGAFVRAPMPGPLYRMHGVTTGAYAIRHLAISNRMVLTNKMPVSLVRGFGGPQVHFAIERLVERIARELRLDPLDVRRRNLVPSGSFPYRTAAGALLDSGDYHRAVDIAVGEGGLNDLRARRDAAREAGRLYGIGYAAAIETSISNMGYLSTLLPVEERERLGPKGGAIATARVNIDANGGVSVTSDSTPQGQGHRTVLAQVVADQLGLDPYDIAVNVEHDSQRDPWTVAAGNYASRFAGAAAGAAHIAARRLRERLAQIASPYLNVGVDHIEFADGRVFDRNNPDNSIPFYRVAGGAHWLPVQLPKDVAPGLSETACWSPPELQPPNAVDEINTSVAYGFIFDFCGVEVDRDTGEVRIDKYVTMHDAGRLLNPAIAMGQVRGSFAQAIGAAFYE